MIYVDTIRRCDPTKCWPYRTAAHLWADDDEEIHRFAQRLGLRRQWAQQRPGFMHYDVTQTMREAAIRAGAIPQTLRQAGEFSLARLRAFHAARSKRVADATD